MKESEKPKGMGKGEKAALVVSVHGRVAYLFGLYRSLNTALILFVLLYYARAKARGRE